MFMVTKLGDRGVDSSGENRRGIHVSFRRYGGGGFRVVAGIALPGTGTQGAGRGHYRRLGLSLVGPYYQRTGYLHGRRD